MRWLALPLATQLGETEVGQFDGPAGIEEQVGRFDIAVHQTPVMEGLQGEGGLAGHGQGQVRADRPGRLFALRAFTNPLTHRPAVVFQENIPLFAGKPGSDQPDHMGVVDLLQHLRFKTKPALQFGHPEESFKVGVRGEQLEGTDLSIRGGADFQHPAHPPLAEGAENPVTVNMAHLQPPRLRKLISGKPSALILAMVGPES